METKILCPTRLQRVTFHMHNSDLLKCRVLDEVYNGLSESIFCIAFLSGVENESSLKMSEYQQILTSSFSIFAKAPASGLYSLPRYLFSNLSFVS